MSEPTSRPPSQRLHLPRDISPTFVHYPHHSSEGLPLSLPLSLPAEEPKEPNNHGTLQWVGNATCIIEWRGIRFMTDPNFLHQGDHVHLGPGIMAIRLLDPAIDMHDVPPVDFIRMHLVTFNVSSISPSNATIGLLIRFYLLSHLHEDHFDHVVSRHLRPTMPIISTPNAIFSLHDSGFRADRLFALHTWESIEITKEGSDARITVSAMPGQHVTGLVGFLNQYAKVLPPVMGSIVEFERLGGGENGESSSVGEAVGKKFRMYVTGDTLFYDELKEIHTRFPHIDLALLHLGGTTLPIINVMVTMDAQQGVQLIHALQPETSIPIHTDDYDLFKSGMAEFVKAVEEAGLTDRVVYLKRGEECAFDPEGGVTVGTVGRRREVVVSLMRWAEYANNNDDGSDVVMMM
ncbi:hypothetical protein BC937DRAFT_88319 [Endogone sp. FLAS-F59071]|nr:hypothetical protein BC937DRAFT_88319 [Endogone sp. FLAS-F59071]|eukprot:RUS18806.1 hypothetical protein BC937DRAFT_88319 [Endogone sp. FLAS-F59071]